MKRSLPIVAIAIFAVLALAGLSLRGADAQDASPPAVELPPIAVDFAAAWSSRDPAQLVAVYAEDAVFEEIVLDGPVIRGRDEMLTYGEAVYAAFPDFTAIPVDAFVSGDRAVVEWILSGTYRGQFGGLPAGTGQRIEIPVAAVFTLNDDGLIVHDREYWDFATLLSQLGMMPDAEPAGTPTG